MSARAAPRARVLVVDDSGAARATLGRILEEDCGATVVGAACDGEEALREALRLAPDLVVLDLQLPRMDGFTFLRLLMARRPTPVIVVSSHARRGDVFKALALGALEFAAKPQEGTPLEALREALVEKCTLLRALRVARAPACEASPAREPGPGGFAEPARVVAVGASTGGPQAVRRLLAMLPAAVDAGFVVAQHVPERFTTAFADRLGRTTPFSVQEAEGGELIAAGRVLVAPAGRHLEVARDGGGTLRARVAPGVEGPGRCPSVDRLFASVARAAGRRAIGVVLTGTGRDGRAGAAAIRAAGGLVLAESEDAAVVYGMAQAAAESGAVDAVLPLAAIARRIEALGTGS